jgi:hypothetical protein
MKIHQLKAFINKRNKQITLVIKKKQLTKEILKDINKKKRVRVRFF